MTQNHRFVKNSSCYMIRCCCFLLFFHTSAFQLLDKPWSQVSSIPSPRFLPSIFIAYRVQQSHCSSIFHRVLLTRALALPASQLVHRKKSLRIYSSMHSRGLKLMKLTYTRLEDNLIRYRGVYLHELVPATNQSFHLRAVKGWTYWKSQR